MGGIKVLSWIVLALSVVYVVVAQSSTASQSYNTSLRSSLNSAVVSPASYNSTSPSAPINSTSSNYNSTTSPSSSYSNLNTTARPSSLNSTSLPYATPSATPGYVQSNYSSPSLSYNLIADSSSIYFLIQSSRGNITVSGTTNSTYNLSISTTTSAPWVNFNIPSQWPQSSSNVLTCIAPYVLCPDGTCLSPVIAAGSPLNTVCCGYGGNCMTNYTCSVSQLMCPNSVCVSIPALPSNNNQTNTNPVNNGTVVNNSTVINNGTSNSNYTFGNNTVNNNYTVGNNTVNNNGTINNNSTNNGNGTRAINRRADTNYDLTYFCCGHGGICPNTFIITPNVTNTTIPVNNNTTIPINNTTIPINNTTMPNNTIPINNATMNSNSSSCPVLCPDGTCQNITGNYSCCGYGGPCSSGSLTPSYYPSPNYSSSFNLTTISPSANVSMMSSSRTSNMTASPMLNATMMGNLSSSRTASISRMPNMTSSSSEVLAMVPKYQSVGWIVVWSLISAAIGVVVGAGALWIVMSRREKIEFLNGDKIDGL